LYLLNDLTSGGCGNGRQLLPRRKTVLLQVANVKRRQGWMWWFDRPGAYDNLEGGSAAGTRANLRPHRNHTGKGSDLQKQVISAYLGPALEHQHMLTDEADGMRTARMDRSATNETDAVANLMNHTNTRRVEPGHRFRPNVALLQVLGAN